MPSDAPPQVTNKQFIDAIFGEDASWCHVTDFTHDPSDIPDKEHLIAWKGDYFSRYRFSEKQSNQYFTISLFYADDQQVARRRKALYRQTHCVVLDDVKEKLSMAEVQKLPQPSWILETSPGSEQWGYILSTPCTDRPRVENLLDGLVANGLAPDGRDPGMKGVTRYVRLPQGINNKKSKMINGQPWQCRLTLWCPFITTTLEDLAKPFNVNLDALRREARVDGAAEVNDHPLLDLNDIIHVKEVRSDGRFDVTCPWVDEHTGADDSGTAIFTNGDGTLGFKCHHGACQERTGRHLLSRIEEEHPGFGAKLTHWQTLRAFNAIKETAPVEQPVALPDFTKPEVNQTVTEIPVPLTQPEQPGYCALINMLRVAPPFSDEARKMAAQILKSIDSLAPIDKIHLHDQVRDIMRWTKPEFNQILKDLRADWYLKSSAEVSFFNEVVYIAEQNQFFNREKRIFYTAEAYQNAYCHLDPDARKTALQGGRVVKVDRIDYAPKKPTIFTENGITYANSWFDGYTPEGTQGDVSRWLDHFKVLGWEKERDHLLKWMAFTIRHPDIKINHMIILGSSEGGGKDWLLYPLMKALGDNHMTIDGDELLSDFDDYKLMSKHLHINEVELSDHNDAVRISNKLKPLSAAPPARLRVNQKSIKKITVRNIINVSMTTNSNVPIKFNGTSRRVFAVWSNINIRDSEREVLPEWQEYWEDRWGWMEGEGADACIWYLRNVVDLTGFKPGAAPPMTDFLRDMIDASKPPLQQTVEAFIREEVDAFKCDVLSVTQMEKIIKTSQFSDALVCVDKRYLTGTRIEQVLKSMMINREARCENGKVWVIRNHQKYIGMTDDQIFNEYIRQDQLYKSSTILTTVK